MKNIIRKIKNWLIDKLGGYTKADMNLLYKSQVAVRNLMLQAWANVVQEICRRSDNTYYPFCCEYCATPCKKPSGWCKDFWPSTKKSSGGILKDDIFPMP